MNNIVTFAKNTTTVKHADPFVGTLPANETRESILEKAAVVDEWRENVMSHVANEVTAHFSTMDHSLNPTISVDGLSLGGKTTLAVHCNKTDGLFTVTEFDHGDLMKEALQKSKELFGPF